MGKKKQAEGTLAPVDIEALEKDMNDRHGTSVMVNASDIADRPRQIISISPTLDFATGGIPEGSWVLLSGTPKCGKSTTALQIAANAQQQYGKQVVIGNVEHRINEKELRGIHNLDISKVKMIQSTPKKILTAQDFLQEFTSVIKTIPECVLIIDSSSALCATKEYTEDITSQARNEGPKLLATFCRKMAAVVPVQKVTLIVIQHLIANTSGFGSPYYEDGGNKIQYQGDLKLRCYSFQKWNAKQDDDSTRIGQVVNWQIMTSALGAPGGKVQSYLRYGYGVDDIKESIDLGLDMGVLDKAGAWYTFGDIKAQGEHKLRAALLENPDKLQELKDAVRLHMS
jgi:recombination protein RecA